MPDELPIVFRRSARAEFIEARRWYDQQKKGLGAEFAGCIDTVLQRIRRAPKLYAIAYENVRRAPVSRFPYVIYYLAEESRVVVASVIHGRRDVEDWPNKE